MAGYSAAGAPGGCGHRHDVLLVEDDRDSREAVALLLELWGCVVNVAATADQALELLTTTRPCVILLDWGLPGRSGAEFLAHRGVRQSGGSVIVLSGYPRPKDDVGEVATWLLKPG